MEQRCAACRRAGDATSMKATFAWVHPGACEGWLRQREQLGPSWLAELLTSERGFRSAALVLAGAALGQMLFR